MAQVQIKCPNSGLWASVGMQIDASEWESLETSGTSSTCGVCGDVHTWAKGDARIVEWSWT